MITDPFVAHANAANAALNAAQSVAQARISASAGGDWHGWAELATHDLATAEAYSKRASGHESVHGSVFPGVRS